MSSVSVIATAQQCQRINWEGSLPITLSLAPTSLSSPTMPPSLHRMVPRQAYLHIGLEEDVRLLSKFAPSTNFRQSHSLLSNKHWKDDEASPSKSIEDDAKDEGNKGSQNTKKDNNEEDYDKNTTDSRERSNKPTIKNDASTAPYPICWFEDEETGTPIRWHLFVGVIYDLFRLQRLWCDSENKDRSRPQPLPWKIRVHFTSYPTSLLPLHCGDPRSSTSTLPPSSTQKVDDGLLKIISKHYINSLKTALYVQHNSNRVSRTCMTKNSDLDLWDSIVRNNWGLYREVCQGFDGKSTTTADKNKKDYEGDEGNNATDLHNVPIRILVDSNPAITRTCPPYHEIIVDKHGNILSQKRKMVTVGEVLLEWLPHIFTSCRDHSKETIDDCQWCIQGLQVPWNSPIANLWRALSHPDRFLYIIVSTRKDSAL